MSIAYDNFLDADRHSAVVLRRQLLIDGQHVESASGKTFNTLNPATGEVIATIFEGGEADVERAVAVARRAFEGVRAQCPSERGQIPFRFAELLESMALKSPSLKAAMPASRSLRYCGRIFPPPSIR